MPSDAQRQTLEGAVGVSGLKRLESIDALRGFVMFVILGGDDFLSALSQLICGQESTWLSRQMEHVVWEGLHFYDVIFPLFLFVSGVTFPFSMARRLSRGDRRSDLARNVLRRMLLLIALGAVFERIQAFNWPAFRVWSVIGRIGLVWAVAALLTLFVRRRTAVMVAVAILLGWWAFLRLVPSPDASAGADGLACHATCFACWFDVRYLTTAHRFEGGLATLAMVPTALFGIWAGEWLRNGRHLTGMIPAGGVLIAVGLLWSWPSWGCPVVKNIWSGSFALVTGGVSLVLLCLFHELIDLRGWRAWSLPFTIIGVNAIAVYLSNAFVPYDRIGEFFFGALIPLVDSATWRGVVRSGGKLLVIWACLSFLYRRRIFFKV